MFSVPFDLQCMNCHSIMAKGVKVQVDKSEGNE